MGLILAADNKHEGKRWTTGGGMSLFLCFMSEMIHVPSLWSTLNPWTQMFFQITLLTSLLHVSTGILDVFWQVLRFEGNSDVSLGFRSLHWFDSDPDSGDTVPKHWYCSLTPLRIVYFFQMMSCWGWNVAQGLMCLFPFSFFSIQLEVRWLSGIVHVVLQSL